MSFSQRLPVAPRGGMQTYTDLARRSPLPARADGKTVAVRNSSPLVNAALDQPGGVSFHFDAELNSMEELVAQSELLNRGIARSKTPNLRDLRPSAPFMHNGQFDTLDDVLDFYREVSDQARAGMLRNGAMQLQGIALLDNDVAPLDGFLNSLNEDDQ
jgi:hypothetical protein